MKKTINFYEFNDLFNKSIYKDHFSYEGRQKLFEVIEELEEATGQEFEANPIMIAIEWTEYANIVFLLECYPHLNASRQMAKLRSDGRDPMEKAKWLCDLLKDEIGLVIFVEDSPNGRLLFPAI